MDLATTNNQTFVWTVSLARWALLLDLPHARFQMQIRSTVDDPNVALSFDSQSGGVSKGTCVYDPVSQTLTMRAPFAVMRLLEYGNYVFGLVATLPLPSAGDPFVKLFAAGAIVIAESLPR